MWWLVFACAPRPLATCDCPEGVAGHAVVLDGACSCLPQLDPLPDPPDATEIPLASGEALDWAAIDAALAEGDVVVRFAVDGVWDEHVPVLREDTGPHRLVLHGGGGDARAVVAGIKTPFEGPARHRVTVRGFEITGSRDKGVYWRGGDDVWLEDLVIHDNGGSPALSFDYSNRTGLPSTGLSIRNSHIYDQRGECLYIGGSEGEDLDSHTDVRVENNLIHDCHDPFDTKHDAINIKDRLANVSVVRNVVGRTDWGIEVASPGIYAHNLVFDTRREGFQVSDAFQPTGHLVFTDNAVLGAGHDAFHFSAMQAPMPGLVMERNTVVGAERAGVLLAGEHEVELSLRDTVVVGSDVGFDGWGVGLLDVEGCGVGGNALDFDRAFDAVAMDCETGLAVPDVSNPAGPDGLFFTGDDPWLLPGGAMLGGP